MPLRHLKDHYREARIYGHRTIVAAVLVLGLVSLLLARFHNLQVTHHDDYVTRSDRNRVHVQPVPPTRGLIYDRKGILLADNRPSYTLSIIRERVGELDTTIELLRELLPIADTDLAKFRKQMRQRRRPFEAVPLRYRLTEAEIARIAVNEYRLPGVEVQAQLVRHYPHRALFAHSVGYVGRINDRELAAFDEEKYRRYSGTHTLGKIGLERRYEQLLLGTVGNQNVETNARGQVLRVLDRTDPVPGQNLTLHLDSQLQRVAYEALNGRRGAVVALDVTNGGVLAMVSTPSYDPNLFVTGISYKNYSDLKDSLDVPLFNRTLQGQYPAASTVKPMLGLAALHYKVIEPEFSVPDPGFYRLKGEERKYRDWKPRGHGKRVDLRQAITESCDTFFYDVAFRMGIDRISPFGLQFGLGNRTGVDVPSERRGIWPSREWKRRARGLPWFPGDSLNVGIGQGAVLVTPIQLATMTSTLATRGVRKRPHLVQAVGTEVQAPEIVGQMDVSEAHWDYIFSAMEEVMHGRRGTGKSVGRGAKYKIAGKTGTAQVVGIAQGEKYDSAALAERKRDHALFVGFAPADAPRIAVAVVVENGEKSSQAALIARKLFDAYLLDEANIQADIRASADSLAMSHPERSR